MIMFLKRQQRNQAHFILLKAMVAALSFSMCSNSFSAEFDFSGFLSLAGGQLDSSEATYLNYTDDFSLNNDSKIGFQLNATLNEEWSLTSQLVIKNYSYTRDDSYAGVVTMAFLSYKPSLSHRFRAGVFPAPYYYFSDYIDVGTAYPWVRTPNTMYNEQFLEFGRYAGVDYVYRTNLGGWFVSVQSVIGQIEDTDNLDGHFDFSASYGLNFVLSRDELTLRFSLLNSKAKLDNTNVESSGLIEGLASYSVAPGLSSLGMVSDAFKLDDLENAYRAVGLMWEPGHWAFYGELYDIDTGNSLSGSHSGGYASLLYQINRFAPYVILSYSNKQADSSLQDAIESTYISHPEGADNTLDALRVGASRVVEGNDVEFRTIGLGLRYDLTESAVFKFEVEQISSVDQQNNGGFRHLNDSYNGASIYLYTFSVDLNF